MKLIEFDYELPPELIAQVPLPQRDGARMLALDRATGRVEHRMVADIPQFLEPGDLLIFNDTRVVPARLFGKRPSGGEVECLVLRAIGATTAHCLIRSGAKKIGLEFNLQDWAVAKVVSELTEVQGAFLVEFSFKEAKGFDELLERAGKLPLPPYVHREADIIDKERYQTIYARASGSVAAPTAGLHFTPELLAAVEARGVDIAFLTLHVGIGTFRPITVEEIEGHSMHEEDFFVPRETIEKIKRAKSRGGRVVAVGTTTVRTLESLARQAGAVLPQGNFQGKTNLFLRPGEEFLLVDKMITNFHQPCSSLLVMVSTFAGVNKIKFAYEEAIRKKYRFHSYGDAMFIS